MSYSNRRSRGIPFCRPTAAGPPLAVTLLLGALVTVGGVGGVATYVTREKPKGEGRDRPTTTTRPASDTPPPPPVDTRPFELPTPPPPTQPPLEELKTAQRATGALLAKVALLIQRRVASTPTASESRSSLASWGEMSRAAQEEASKDDPGTGSRSNSDPVAGTGRGIHAP